MMGWYTKLRASLFVSPNNKVRPAVVPNKCQGAPHNEGNQVIDMKNIGEQKQCDGSYTSPDPGCSMELDEPFYEWGFGPIAVGPSVVPIKIG